LGRKREEEREREREREREVVGKKCTLLLERMEGRKEPMIMDHEV
jgi:hypothetical protein